ncbi:unnamed protein product, partial [Ixodes pacificus]
MGVDLSVYRARIGCFSYSLSHGSSRRYLFVPRALAFVPRAHVLLLALCLCNVLILAGDVELNPGPGDLDKLQSTLEKVVQSTEQYQRENATKLSSIADGVKDLTERVTHLEKRLEDLARVQNDVVGVQAKIATLENEVKAISATCNHLSSVPTSVDALDNRQRRNNLIFKGLPEEDKESWNRSEQIVKNFIQTHLGIEAGEIERAHRLGGRRGDYPRPIIVNFRSFKKKQEILENASKLKQLENLRVWIDEDFSPNIRHARKMLWKYGKPLRSSQTRVRLVFDKLFVGDRMFFYNAEPGDVIEQER